MKHTPARIMQAALTEGSGAPFTNPSSNAPWPLFLSALPDSANPADPQNVAAVYDTDGTLHARLLASGKHLRSFGIQLRVRGRGYADTYAKAYAAAQWMESQLRRMTLTIDSTTYTIDTVTQTSGVVSMGQDALRRSNVSINVLLALMGE